VPLALRLRASCPSQRSVPPPCRPGVAKQARLGRRISPGGSLRVAWVVRVSLSRSTQRYSKPSKSNTYSSECGERSSKKFTRSPSTLSAYSQTHPPYWTFSGLGDCPNNLILSFPSSEKVPTPVYTDTEAALFTEVRGRHVLRTASLPHSPKLNFRFTEFCELGTDLVLRRLRVLALDRWCGTIPDPYASARHRREGRPRDAYASRRPRPPDPESMSPRRPRRGWRSLVRYLPRRRRPSTHTRGRR
jgi:hypothetical protein